jgi:hypothetical protein
MRHQCHFLHIGLGVVASYIFNWWPEHGLFFTQTLSRIRISPQFRNHFRKIFRMCDVRIDEWSLDMKYRILYRNPFVLMRRRNLLTT